MSHCDTPVQSEPQNSTVNTSRQALQTSQVEAIGEITTVPVQLLLDNGNQLSNITTSLKSRLKLNPVQQEKLSLNTFGSDSFITRGCDIVKLMLQRPEFGNHGTHLTCDLFKFAYID